MDEWLMPGIPRTIADEPDTETVRRIRASVTKDTGQVVESDLLLPCPFCGGEAIYGKSEASGRVRAVCVDCLASTDWLAGTDEAGVSVLCRGKNGALYVGKPVTLKGNATRKVWVPRGDQYRTPEKWMEIEERAT